MKDNNFIERHPYIAIFIVILIFGYFYTSLSDKYLEEKYGEDHEIQNKLIMEKIEELEQQKSESTPTYEYSKESEIGNELYGGEVEQPKSDSLICSYNKYNCADFSTYSEAKKTYDGCGGVTNDVHHLDRDGDNIPCEELYYGKKWQE
ncbi:excalibur calcium-binding domain-containing protein [Candidatus Woesearchaeota archaeon]|jgi:hypothetical protein|nr:excalibur calcium-binding domain-containing protein [Candidatus Woesearchaeota archaeon]